MNTKHWENDKDLIDAFSLIDAIDFTYNDKAKELFGNDYGVDNDEHIGVKAQDLEENPATPNVVNKDESGYLTVDTNELTLNNTAVISELCKKVKELEEAIEELRNGSTRV